MDLSRLTPVQRQIVDVLAERGGWVSGTELADAVAMSAGTSTLGVHVHQIRRKLGPDVIRSAYGLGYRWTGT